MKLKSKKQALYLNITTIAIVMLSHIIFVALFLITKRYINLNPNVYFSVFGILICLLILIDFLFLIGSVNKDRLLKNISLVFSIVFLLIGFGVVYAVTRINTTLEKVVVNSGEQQHEKLIVNFVAYDNKKITVLEDLQNKKVGILHTDDQEVGVIKLGKEYLEKHNIQVKYQEYNTFLDMMLALINKDIEAVIVDNTYKSQLKTNEGFESAISKFIDIESFEQNVLVGTHESSNKDIVSHPFTVLLIGYAPEPGGGGLADSIILASINPQDLVVTFTSIPRDSYVPISCYNGKAKDKITHARGISRNCLINSVSDLLDVDIDFYAEINFKGIVDVVDALGGIVIDSPIEFVGQNSDTERGNMTVWIGKGVQLANGEQALAFARERKQMPNGDFDRQKHQQQVIKQIVKRIIEVKDVNKLLSAIEIAGDNFSTNLNINQMISMLNHLSEIKVYNGFSSFDAITFNSMRLAGYSSWSYNYGMQQALWVYPIFNGSIIENRKVIDETLDKDGLNTHAERFKFEWRYTYEYRKTYSTEFPNEAIVHEELPDILPNFTSMTLSQARDWAAQRGINLIVDYVTQGDSRWFENGEGTILSQSEESRPGLLVANVKTVHISAIDQPDAKELVPNFVGGNYDDLLAWAQENNYGVEPVILDAENIQQHNIIKAQNIPANSLKRKYNKIKVEVYVYKYKDVSKNALDALRAGKASWSLAEVQNWKNTYLMGSLTTSEIETNEQNLDGKLHDYSFNPVTDPIKENSSLHAVFYKFKATTPKPSDPSNGTGGQGGQNTEGGNSNGSQGSTGQEGTGGNNSGSQESGSGDSSGNP